MDNETFGMIVVTIISLLFLFGMGSIVLSFFFDPKESNISKNATQYNYSSNNRVASKYYTENLTDEPASVIIDDIPTFDFDGIES